MMMGMSMGMRVVVSRRMTSRALCCLSEEEEMLRETVAKFATSQIAPLVSQMDQEEAVHASVLKGLFENGVNIIIGTNALHFVYGDGG